MTAVAPHRFSPALEPEALIEEARRRTRRRRLAYIAAALAGLVAVGVWAIVAWSGGAPTSANVPPGFAAVHGRGPVGHVLIGYHAGGWTTVDLATGRQRRASRTEELWYEPRSGLWRDVYRIDGRTKSEQAGRCRLFAKQLPCSANYPLSYLRPYLWPPAKTGYHLARRGSFRGRPVIWLEPPKRVRLSAAVTEIGVEVATHRILVERWFLHGRLSGFVAVEQKPDLPASTRFLLPARGAVPVAPNATFQPWSGVVHAYGLPAARKALGRAPLWLGPRFRGFFLRSVTSGAYRADMAGPSEKPVRFVHFFYTGGVGEGYAISIEELGAARPWFDEQGPRPGSLELLGTANARLSRTGLLLRITTASGRFRLTGRNGVALAKALRPLPAGLRTLPTLHEQ